MFEALKRLVRYQKEEIKETQTIRPVRGPDGRPAKHLEVLESGKQLHITKGWFNKIKEVKEL